jgi:hypothetical protein
MSKIRKHRSIPILEKSLNPALSRGRDPRKKPSSRKFSLHCPTHDASSTPVLIPATTGYPVLSDGCAIV